jgi:hypothetical protein
MRVSGIDKDFSSLEILFYQADQQEQMELIATYLANKTRELGGIKLDIVLDDDTSVTIQTKVNEL